MKTVHLEWVFRVHGVEAIREKVFVHEDQFPRPSGKLREVSSLPLFHKLDRDAQW